MVEHQIIKCKKCGKILGEWDIGLIAKDYSPIDITTEVYMVDECPHFKLFHCKYSDNIPSNAICSIWEDNDKWYWIPIEDNVNIEIIVKEQ